MSERLETISRVFASCEFCDGTGVEPEQGGMVDHVHGRPCEACRIRRDMLRAVVGWLREEHNRAMRDGKAATNDSQKLVALGQAEVSGRLVDDGS